MRTHRVLEIVELNITDEDHNWTETETNKTEAALKETELISRFNTDPWLNRYTGYLGEKLFSKWLDSIKIKHEWQTEKYGESDDYDFKINEKLIDIKTNIIHYPEALGKNYTLMLNKNQIGLHADIYFWVLIHVRPSRTLEGKLSFQKIDLKNAKKAMLIGSMHQFKCEKYPTVEKISGVESKQIPIEDVIPASHFKWVIED